MNAEILAYCDSAMQLMTNCRFELSEHCILTVESSEMYNTKWPESLRSVSDAWENTVPGSKLGFNFFPTSYQLQLWEGLGFSLPSNIFL